MRLGNELRAAQVSVREAEDEELVGIGIGTGEVLQEIVVVGHPEGVNRVTLVFQIRAEGSSFNLGRDLVHSKPVCGKYLDHIQQKSLAHGASSSLGSIQVGDVNRAVQIDLEDLLHLGLAAIAEAFAVAFVYHEFVVVESSDVADAAAGGQQICILVCCAAGGDVDGDHAQQIRCIATLSGILDERVLHNADESLTIGSDGQSFHALVGYAAAGIAGYLRIPGRCQIGYVEALGQLEGAQTLTIEAKELVDIWAVLVGDEDREPVVRNANALRV